MSKKNNVTFGGYGLTEEEDTKLIKILRRKDRPAKQVVRELLREYIEKHKHLTT